MEVRVEGLSSLRLAFVRAGGDLKEWKAVNKDAAGVVVPVARSGAPNVSGRLARTVRAGATQKAGIIRVGNNTNTPYAGPIHFGWPARNIKAQPFATDAAQSTEPAWLLVYERRVDQILNKI